MAKEKKRETRAQIEGGMTRLAEHLEKRAASPDLTLGELARKMALIARAVSDLSSDSRI